jgi:hypothetical protein
MEYYEGVNDEPMIIEESVEDWVIQKCDDWRDHFEANYSVKFDEYYRLWRGIWASEDKTRDSERSRIISPALQQAVESSVAELEEATFGRGKWFDIKDDRNDAEAQDIVYLREQLHEDFGKTKIRKSVAECLINAAVFGTGVAEVVVSEEKEMMPATQPVMDGQLTAVGVNIRDRVVVKLRPVMPQNFLIDPVATSVEDALGVAIDEFVSRHIVEQLQEQGVYKKCHLGNASEDFDLEPDQELTLYQDDKIRLTKYYGLVPRHLLKEADEEEGIEGLGDDQDEDDSYYVEAVVVIANGGKLLKAEASPYMMQDRPVVAFPWDVVPSRFWGRGVCEKGYNSQKALDAELRARIDALALTIHPMMAMDASRIPRGSKPEVRPGKLLLTNGDPREVLHQFNFGSVAQITFAQASALQSMVQQATGAVDSTGIAGSVNGDATAAGISMSLGAVIKRHKRTLINFQESFLLPFVMKAAWRYMQFEPELYPVKDYKFNATSSLGIIAREYEVTQLVQLLQTMSPDSPLYPVLIQSIIDNMNLSNREELIAMMKKSQEPNPQAQQAQQAQQQAQLAFQAAQTQTLQAQAMESQARAQKMQVEAQAIPQELEIDKIKAITSNIKQGEEDDIEFERRLKIADRMLKDKEITLRNQRPTGGQANGGNPEPVQPSTGGNQQQLQQITQETNGVGSEPPVPRVRV